MWIVVVGRPNWKRLKEANIHLPSDAPANNMGQKIAGKFKTRELARQEARVWRKWNVYWNYCIKKVEDI